MTTTTPEELVLPEVELIDMTEFETKEEHHLYSLRDWQSMYIYDRQYGDIHVGIKFKPNRTGTASKVIRENDGHLYHLCHAVSFVKGDEISAKYEGVCNCSAVPL